MILFYVLTSCHYNTALVSTKHTHPPKCVRITIYVCGNNMDASLYKKAMINDRMIRLVSHDRFSLIFSINTRVFGGRKLVGRRQGENKVFKIVHYFEEKSHFLWTHSIFY